MLGLGRVVTRKGKCGVGEGSGALWGVDGQDDV